MVEQVNATILGAILIFKPIRISRARIPNIIRIIRIIGSKRESRIRIMAWKRGAILIVPVSPRVRACAKGGKP